MAASGEEAVSAIKFLRFIAFLVMDEKGFHAQYRLSYGADPFGLTSPLCTRRFSISLVRAGQADPFCGVKLLCSDSIIGSGSLGPGI
jgi:hypothetical protein